MEILNEWFTVIGDSPLIRGVLLSAAVLALTWLLHLLVFFVLKHYAGIRPRDTMSQLIAKVRRPSRRLLLSTAAWLLIPALGIPEGGAAAASHGLLLIVILSITNLAISGIRTLTALLLRQFDTTQRDNLQARKVNTQVKVFEQIGVTAIIIIAVSTALMTFEGIQQIGASILASAGIAGLVIGVAAQKSLGNVVAGIMIAITQPIRLDDAVLIENEWGRIEEITLTYVVVCIWDKRRLVVPINYFVDNPFQNWTRTSSDILGTVMLHLDYRMPVDTLRKKQSAILSDCDLWDGKVDVVQVVDTTPTTMVVRCLVSAVDSPTAWDLRVLLRERLLEFLQQEYSEYLPRTRVEASVSEYPAPAPAKAQE